MESCEISKKHEIELRPKPATKKKRIIETGVLYFSRIPALMSVKKMRELLSEYGEVGRIYLQPKGER